MNQEKDTLELQLSATIIQYLEGMPSDAIEKQVEELHTIQTEREELNTVQMEAEETNSTQIEVEEFYTIENEIMKEVK